MFLETKREGEAKTGPSLAGLIAWLKTQPADGIYNFHDCHGRCLIGLYMASIGVPELEYATRDGTYMQACMAVFGGNGQNAYPATARPWTFGAALERARKF